ncbi:hypothetical protein K474DRAFT_1670646 [Panus rudis PR-1116 ss-1]|nr:hypothetical protein K474DRAFT_1670646 [Panus rudis PR-1116 ss-1]
MAGSHTNGGTVLGKRAAAATALKLAAKQLESSDEDADANEEFSRRAARPHKSRLKGRASNTSASNSLASQARKRPSIDARDHPPARWDDDMELTPLSSPELRTDLSLLPVALNGHTVPDNRKQDSDEHPINPAPLLESSSRPVPVRESSYISISSGDEDPSSEDHHSPGSIVWVRINTMGDVSFKEQGTMWWPGKVTQSRPLVVSLFGRSPGSIAEDRKLHVTHPSPLNVLSLTESGRSLRFNPKTYSNLTKRGQPSSSPPSKRQKLHDSDLHSRWEDAFQLMLEYDRVNNNDGLPRFLSFYRHKSPSSLADDSDDSVDVLEQDDIDDDDELWIPPEANPLYEIPGEHVLAKEKSALTQYWPGKIMEYIPPKNRRGKPAYRILFFDGTMKNLTPDLFFVETDPGFKDCILGEDEANYGLDEREDVDTIPDVPPDDFSEESLRATTPPPLLPPPNDFAFAFTIDEQLEYVKPVLTAILEERYEPARRRHDAFMKSEATRKVVCDASHDQGELSAKEVEMLDGYIRRWVRRRLRRVEAGYLPINNSPPSQDHGDNSEQECTVQDHDASPLTLRLPQSPGSDAATEILSDATLPPGSFVSLSNDSHNDVEDGVPNEALHAQIERPDAQTPQDNVTFECPPPEQALPCDQKVVVPETADGHPSSGDKPSNTRRRNGFYSLSEIEQITYCTNILLPEAVFQILLWRSGLRQSYELLSDGEEERLRELGMQKAQEGYWVQEIVLYKRGLNREMISQRKVARRDGRPTTSRLRSGRL